MSSPALSELFSISTPVIAQWRHQSLDVEYLGCASPHPLLEVFHESRKRHASLKSRVSIGVKGYRKKVKVYLLVSPEHVQRLGLDESNIPEPVRDAFIKSNSSVSADGIVRLCFSLKQAPVVLGPPDIDVLEPKTTTSGSLLNALHSLARASTFSFHIPRDSIPLSRLESLCADFSSGTFSLCEGEIESLYLGKGAKVIEQHNAAAESPPSYDELALSSPPPRSSYASPQRASSGKRRRRTSDVAGRRDDDWTAAGPEQLDALRKQIGEMREDVNAASASLAGRQHLTNCLDGFATQISSLWDHVSSMEERIQKKIRDDLTQRFEARITETKDHLLEHVEERLGEVQQEIEDEAYERLEEAKDEMDEVLHVKLDDRLLDVKLELQQSVKEELETVEDTIRADLRNAL
ncbi:hypothetical protein B0J12DRAFT_745556 [Macrophomina phaseolina]|uniref:Uncharacterized protein n=1 Tax=Macrophomina phaseolina TaxID=35725 RepID=A0ABQ8FV08_9PEZI|nr:hypothetical protein B0J12DRAFT_745556 [Macrophomina phaseolina]